MTRTPEPPARSPSPEGRREVSRFEFNLIRILRFMLGHSPADQGMQLVRSPSIRSDCLSAAAVEVVQDTLAKASVLFLVRQGGWRNDRYLRGGVPSVGRVWERIPLDERSLTFSRLVLDFLIWATAEKVTETKVVWDAPHQSLTPADELFFWQAFDSIRSDPELLAAFRLKDVFRRNPFCWISFPGDMVETDDVKPPPLESLFEGQRAVFLECLQHHLEQRWTRSESMKGQLGDWKRMRLQGRAEFASLRAFLEAAATHNRRDLARFLLRTNASLFATEMMPVFWTGGLAGSGPARLADRLDTQRAALAVPRQMEILEQWQQQALSVGYFDEEYQASQMWKAEWEKVDGDRVAARARETVQMLEPLHAGGGGTNNPPSQPASEERPDGQPGT